MSDILIKDYTGEQVLMLIEEDRRRKRGCKYCEDEANIFEWDEIYKGAWCWELMI